MFDKNSLLSPQGLTGVLKHGGWRWSSTCVPPKWFEARPSYGRLGYPTKAIQAKMRAEIRQWHFSSTYNTKINNRNSETLKDLGWHYLSWSHILMVRLCCWHATVVSCYLFGAACLSYNRVDLRVIPNTWLVIHQAWRKVTITLAFIPPIDLVSAVILQKLNLII